MTASSHLEQLVASRDPVTPIFRKTASRAEGANAFSRAYDVELVMDALPELLALVNAAEELKRGESGRNVQAMVVAGTQLGDALAALESKLARRILS